MSTLATPYGVADRIEAEMKQLPFAGDINKWNIWYNVLTV